MRHSVVALQHRVAPRYSWIPYWRGRRDLGCNGGMQVRTLLYVDDDERVLSITARTLGRDRRVFTATSAVTALAIAARETIDLALVDLCLGADNGCELIRELVGRQPTLVAILMSGMLSYPATVEAVKAGAFDVVAKPFSVPALLARLEHPDIRPSRAYTPPSLDRVVWEYVHRVVGECGGNLSEAARCLGIDRNTLKRRLARSPIG